jgi:UDP-glucose 4-epimerase
VFGNDYDTPDGFCIRDFVHIEDLARAHVVSLSQLESKSGLFVYNVGTGTGVSVLELISTLNKILIEKQMKPIEYKIGARRDGDIVVCYANVDKIYEDTGFRTEYDLRQMCIDGLKFIGL